MRKAIAGTIVGIVGTLVAVVAVAGQAPAPAPKPGPEHKKLEYFVGKWTTTGDMKPNPFMPAGKFTSTDTCEWFQGGFAVTCSSVGASPAGPTKGLAILGYSADQKVYTYYGVDNTVMTMTTVPKGTIQGDTWTYNDEAMMGGQKLTSRYVLKLAPASYTFKWEMLGPDGKWATIVDGTSTKTK